MMNPFKTKKGLGRGLSSLIGDVDSKPIKNKMIGINITFLIIIIGERPLNFTP